jgi:hypothetical protein
VFLPERVDADSTSTLSWYSVNLDLPMGTGGSFNVTIKLTATGLAIGNDYIPAYSSPSNNSNASILSIFNMALGLAGVSRFVQDIAENSNEAIVCSTYFEQCRDTCLADFPWNFAMRYSQLQIISSPPVTQYANRFTYPADCLVARFIAPLNTYTLPAPGYTYAPNIIESMRQKYPFVVVENEANNGLALETDLLQPVVVYTARVVTVALWSAKFIEALTWLLTSKIAPALSSDVKFTKAAADAYAMAILQAGASNMNESGRVRRIESSFLEARE